jgi:hypothetical protein
MCKFVPHVYLSKDIVPTVSDKDPLRAMFQPALSGPISYSDEFMFPQSVISSRPNCKSEPRYCFICEMTP